MLDATTQQMKSNSESSCFGYPNSAKCSKQHTGVDLKVKKWILLKGIVNIL